MSTVSNRSDLLSRLTSVLQSHGLTVEAVDADGLAAEHEAIRAKWFLGGRKIAYKMSCRLSEQERIVRFREMVVERSWGIPPPALTVETSTVGGWKRSGTRADRAVGGGGTLDYAAVRDAGEAAVTAAGWTFRLEGGRMP